MSSASCLFAPPPARRSYDHRLRQAICDTGDLGLFDSVVRIPRSTAKSWLRRGRPTVVSLDDEGQELADLRLQVVMLERRIEKYRLAMRKLAAKRRAAREARLAENRALACSACVPENGAKSAGVHVRPLAS